MLALATKCYLMQPAFHDVIYCSVTLVESCNVSSALFSLGFFVSLSTPALRSSTSSTSLYLILLESSE